MIAGRLLLMWFPFDVGLVGAFVWSWLIAAVVAVTVNVTVMLPLLLWGEFSFGAVSVSVVEVDCV